MKSILSDILDKIQQMSPEELTLKWEQAKQDTAHLNSPNLEEYMNFVRGLAIVENDSV